MSSNVQGSTAFDRMMFGVATSDHQFEGYDHIDDIWDVWERRAGKVPRGKATDFWNRYAEDVASAQALGCTMFRFSVSWARLEPAPQQYDADAFDHYARLLESVRSAGMEPMLTIMHDVWPVHVEEAGGLLADDFPDRFVRFTQEVVNRLGQKVKYWVTFNEPNVLLIGYLKPWWQPSYLRPPGLPADRTIVDQTSAVAAVMRNLFLAHARGRAVIQGSVPGARVSANVGILGLPLWLQLWMDRGARTLESLEDLVKKVDRYTQPAIRQRGKVDLVLALFTKNAARASQMDFSDAYHMASQTLLVRSDSPIEQVSDLRMRVVGVVKTTTAASSEPGPVASHRRREFRHHADMRVALDRKQVDAVLADDSILDTWAEEQPHSYRILQRGLSDEPYAIAMTRGNPQLFAAVSAALRKFVESGSWAEAFQRHFPGRPIPDPPTLTASATLADLSSQHREAKVTANGLPPQAAHGSVLRRAQDRGRLVVGIRQDVPGFGYRDPTTGQWSGLEVDLARAIAGHIFGDPDTIEFRPIVTRQRSSVLKSRWRFLEPILRLFTILSTFTNTSWWYLGMVGSLPDFLCPPECVRTCDFVGFDYYWGVDTWHLYRLGELFGALTSESYRSAPVWPRGLYVSCKYYQKLLPDMPIIVVENGSVDVADGVTREAYLNLHIEMLQRAVKAGAPVIGYLYWAITTNREWGNPFSGANDFGLNHIELDADPRLTRTPTAAWTAYKAAISSLRSDGK
jgi:beta-glucosidase/6-phospho-beta-glucosidase/beta-galactosidase/ABC-type amino acid transport substrate-binding protein